MRPRSTTRSPGSRRCSADARCSVRMCIGAAEECFRRGSPAGNVDPAHLGEESKVYEKDGEKYFVVDGHLHFWDASPANWVPGQEKYAKGWIECFHAYQGLGPPE